MKKIFTVILLAAVMVLCCLPLTGCRYLAWKMSDHEADGFIYELDRDNNAKIKGLADPKKEVDVLVIPQKLDSYPVTTLGVITSVWGASDSYHGLDARNVKRIVINHELYFNKECAIQNFTGELTINVNSLRGFGEYHNNEYCDSFLPSRVMINSNNQDLYAHFWAYVNYKSSVRYYLVYFYAREDEPVFCQLVRENGTTVEPDLPLKEDPTFKGWYTEDGERWNFQTVVTERAYLYAKWDKRT
ncbi:MAG: InlB B-repeat-containing protein [Clostridiales bacterium]|nr:InlB B-repeat-containing protein [Clostridiales bacterium]